MKCSLSIFERCSSQRELSIGLDDYHGSLGEAETQGRFESHCKLYLVLASNSILYLITHPSPLQLSTSLDRPLCFKKQ